MDQLVQLNISEHTCYIDDGYIDGRMSCIEKATSWTSDHYLAWRQLLMQQKASQSKLIVRDIGDRRDEYLQRRYQLLDTKYKKSEIQSNRKNSVANTVNNNNNTVQSNQQPNRIRSDSNTITSPPTTTNANTINTNANNNNNNNNVNNQEKKVIKVEDFIFSGIHHIFDQHKKSITRIRYANSPSNDLLAFSSDDGTVSICQSMFKPSVLGTLKGHTGPIIDFIWSNDNQRIVTISTDGTLRIWSAKTFAIEKIIKDAGICLCLCNHPNRSPLVIVSENKSLIRVLDIQSGKWLSKVKSINPVLSMQFEPKGDYLFLGDERGYIFIFKFDKDSFSLVSKKEISTKPITSLTTHYWYLDQKPGLSILVNSKDNVIRVFSVVNLLTGTFILSKEYQSKTQNIMAHSNFCPLKDRNGLFIVSGGEDSIVNIYNVLKKDSKRAVNQLMGHVKPVIDVVWNSDESLLASADSSGVVIVWSNSIIPK